MEGHAHNDVLSIEMQVHGLEILRDPGSFTYSEMPNERNLYRSVSSHFPSQILKPWSDEQFGKFLFTFPNRVFGRPLYFQSNGFIGTCETRGVTSELALELNADHVLIRLVSSQAIDSLQRQPPRIIHSSAYGRREDTPSYRNDLIVALD